MLYEKDWMMRQIQQLVQFIARLLFHKDTIAYEIADAANPTASDDVHRRLMELLAQRDLCGAEDYLFENYRAGDPRYLELAVDFYQRLNGMSDETLEECGFPRDEIESGLQELLKMEDIGIVF